MGGICAKWSTGWSVHGASWPSRNFSRFLDRSGRHGGSERQHLLFLHVLSHPPKRIPAVSWRAYQPAAPPRHDKHNHHYRMDSHPVDFIDACWQMCELRVGVRHRRALRGMHNRRRCVGPTRLRTRSTRRQGDIRMVGMFPPRASYVGPILHESSGLLLRGAEQDQRLSVTRLSGGFTATCHQLGPRKVAGWPRGIAPPGLPQIRTGAH